MSKEFWRCLRVFCEDMSKDGSPECNIVLRVSMLKLTEQERSILVAVVSLIGYHCQGDK